MNIQEADILLQLIREPYINQRILAEGSSHSLGIVNRSIKSLSEDGYLDTAIRPTEKAKKEVAPIAEILKEYPDEYLSYDCER